MRRPAPSTGIPIARFTAAAAWPNEAGRIGGATWVDPAALPQLLDATPGGFTCRLLDDLPAMRPPQRALEMGDGESDELRAAAMPWRMRVEREGDWLAGLRRAYWRGVAAGGTAFALPSFAAGVAVALLGLFMGWW